MLFKIFIILKIFWCGSLVFSYKFEGQIIESTEDLKWPDGIVPYQISPYFTEEESLVIQRALETISNQSCVKFEPHIDQKGYLFIDASRQYSECLSSYGYQPSKQTIYLRATVEIDCVEHSAVLHHLMRVLGFPYEHLRPDRDKYVSIDWSNVRRNKRHMFEKLSKHQFIYDVDKVDFDSSSVMIPDSAHIAVDGARPVLVSKDSKKSFKRGISGLSEEDLGKIINAYNCSINLALKSVSTASLLKISYALQFFALNICMFSMLLIICQN